MTILILLIVFSVIGIAVVFWLLRSEGNDTDTKDIKPFNPQQLKELDIFSQEDSLGETKKEEVIKKQVRDDIPLANLLGPDGPSAEEQLSIGTPKVAALGSEKKQSKSIILKLIGPLKSLLEKKPKKIPRPKTSLSLGSDEPSTEEQLSIETPKGAALGSEKKQSKSIILKLIGPLKSLLEKRPRKILKIPGHKTSLSLKEKLELSIDSLSNVPENNPFAGTEEAEDDSPKETSAKDIGTPDNKEEKSDIIADGNTAENVPEKAIENDKNEDLLKTVSELKNKYKKLETLYNEKCSDLEKARSAYESELQNRKEFNKVKDILEKELKELRDKNRGIQSEFNALNMEKENLKKKFNQVDGKAAKTENELQEKEKTIKDLSGQIKPSGLKVKYDSSSDKILPLDQEEAGPGSEKNIEPDKSSELETGNAIEKMLSAGKDEAADSNDAASEDPSDEKDHQ